MTDRAGADARAQEFFEDLWRRGDYWELESSPFESARYDALVAALGGHRYVRALEIGCGAGVFTRRLATLADHIVAVDVAPAAIRKAQASVHGPATIEFSVANVMDQGFRRSAPFDLVVMSETIYYIGWLYSFFDVAWLVTSLHEVTRPGGRLLLADTCGGCDDALLQPGIIHTYRDLVANLGFAREAERTFRGLKNGASLDVLISLFLKPPAP